jgi:phage-related protein
MNWKINYYRESINKLSPVEEFINNLGKENKKAQVKVLRSLMLLAEYGLDLGFPYISNVANKLWELRVPFGSNHYRVIFTIASNRIIILLHAFTKKTGKIPERELEIARKRLSIVSKERRP